MNYICYHGTCDEIDDFSHEYIGQCTCNNAGGFYFSDDIMIANDYTINSYMRKYEYDYENDICLSRDVLRENAEKQAHVYKCEVSLNNPLILDISEINNKDKMMIERWGNNVIDTQASMSLINIMQNREYENDAGCDLPFYEEHMCYFEDEVYSEDTDEYEYIEKEPYDGLIIKDCIDGIDDYSNENTSTVIIALHNHQIKIVERIDTSDMN